MSRRFGSKFNGSEMGWGSPGFYVLTNGVVVCLMVVVCVCGCGCRLELKGMIEDAMGDEYKED